jgi:hypothetical protein
VKTTYTNFDRVGNATYTTGSFGSSLLGTQDYWYKYDAMNRFVLTEGALSAPGGTISGGVAVLYNARGDRTEATYASDGHIEDYAYSADGYLETVTYKATSASAAIVGAKRTTDVLGRLWYYSQFSPNRGTGAIFPLPSRHLCLRRPRPAHPPYQ